jgi:hypothetical protein
MSIPFLDDVTINGNLSASGSLSAVNFFGSGKYLTDLPTGGGGPVYLANYLPLSGGSLSGNLTALNYFGSGKYLTDIATSPITLTKYLPLSGGSITGNLTATNYFGSGKYLTDIAVGNLTSYLPLSGGSLTGGLSTTNIFTQNNVFVQDSLTVTYSISAGGNLYGYGDHIIFTPKKVVTVIGNNTDHIYNITHNLSSEDIVVSIYDRNTKDVVLTSFKIVDENNISVEFANVPGFALDSQGLYKVVIFS